MLSEMQIITYSKLPVNDYHLHNKETLTTCCLGAAQSLYISTTHTTLQQHQTSTYHLYILWTETLIHRLTSCQNIDSNLQTHRIAQNFVPKRKRKKKKKKTNNTTKHIILICCLHLTSPTKPCLRYKQDTISTCQKETPRRLIMSNVIS